MSNEKIFDPPFGSEDKREKNVEKARVMAEAEAPHMNDALHSEALARELGHDTLLAGGQYWRSRARDRGVEAGKAYDDSTETGS